MNSGNTENKSWWPSFSSSSGPHGLRNQGSTCYLNCVLQVLFMTKDFREAVKRLCCENHNCENLNRVEKIDFHLQHLFNDLKTRVAQTNEITCALGINNVREQRDAAEYLEKILSRTSPDASKIFCGQLRHRNTCQQCQTPVDEDGPCWNLPLPLTDFTCKYYNVEDGIKAFFSSSTVDGENQMYCDECDAKTDVTIKCEMKEHPEVLTLLLKRFEFDYTYMDYIKIDRPVTVPPTLQIPENQTYELYAIVDHFGTLRGGHYTATIKSQDDDSWYEFNDTWVTRLHEQPFLEATTNAYLLMYRKKKIPLDTSIQELNQESSTEDQQRDSNYNDEQYDNPPKHRKQTEGDEAEGSDTAEAVSVRHECVTGETASRETVCVKNTVENALKQKSETPIYKYYLSTLEERFDTGSNGSGGLDDVRQSKPQVEEQKSEVTDPPQRRKRNKSHDATEKDNDTAEAAIAERCEHEAEENDGQRQENSLIQRCDVAYRDNEGVGDVTHKDQEDIEDITELCTKQDDLKGISVEKQDQTIMDLERCEQGQMGDDENVQNRKVWIKPGEAQGEDCGRGEAGRSNETEHLGVGDGGPMRQWPPLGDDHRNKKSPGKEHTVQYRDAARGNCKLDVFVIEEEERKMNGCVQRTSERQSLRTERDQETSQTHSTNAQNDGTTMEQEENINREYEPKADTQQTLPSAVQELKLSESGENETKAVIDSSVQKMNEVSARGQGGEKYKSKMRSVHRERQRERRETVPYRRPKRKMKEQNINAELCKLIGLCENTQSRKIRYSFSR